MEREAKESVRYTPNQVVAYNLRRARLLRGWTQEQTAVRLKKYLGVRWSSASYSVAERSTDRPERIRNFTADEIVAFSRTFQLPVTWFFFPPERGAEDSQLRVGPPEVKEEQALTPSQLVEVILGDPETHALLSLRVDEALRGQPQESAGPLLRLLGELVGIYNKRAIKQAVGEVEQWPPLLRELAVLLEAAGESATNTVESAMSRAVADYYEEYERHLHDVDEEHAGPH